MAASVSPRPEPVTLVHSPSRPLSRSEGRRDRAHFSELDGLGNGPQRSLESRAQQAPAGAIVAPVLPILVCAAAAYQLSVSIINPLLLEIAHDFRIPVALAAQARTIQAAASAVMALIAIFAADRIGRRQQLLYGLGLQGIAALALSVPQPFGIWLIGQAAYGAAAAVVGLAGTAAVGDYVPKARRASAMAWVATGYAIAFLVGLPLAGWLATGWGWRVSYVWAGAGTALVALIGVVVGLPTRQLAVIGAPAPRAGWLRILTEPAPRGWVAGELLSMTGWSVFLVYVGPFFGVTYGLRATEIGLVLAILSAIAILGIRASVPWGRAWGMRRVLLASTLLAAVTVLVPLSLRLSPLLSLLAVAPFMFLGSLRHPTSATIGLGLVPDAKGAMMAARGLTVAVAGLLAASTGGIVLAISGFLGLGPWCAVLLGTGWVFYWRFIPEGIDRSCTTSQGRDRDETGSAQGTDAPHAPQLLDAQGRV